MSAQCPGGVHWNCNTGSPALPLFSELQPGPALPSGQGRGHVCGFSVGLALPSEGPAPWSSQIDLLLFILFYFFSVLYLNILSSICMYVC